MPPGGHLSPLEQKPAEHVPRIQRRQSRLSARPFNEVQDDPRAAGRHAGPPERSPFGRLLHIEGLHRDSEGGRGHGDPWQGRHLRRELSDPRRDWQVLVQCARAHLLRSAQDTSRRFVPGAGDVSGVCARLQ